MPDIRDRFRSLDNQGAPDLWNEASARSRADSPQPSWLPRVGGALAVAAVVALGVFIGLQLTGSPLPGGTGASPSAEPETATASVTEGDFRLTITALRSTWASDEAISVWADLEYLGNATETTVWGSGNGPIGFGVVEVGGNPPRRMEAAWTADCAPHPISGDVPIHAPYSKSGGYSADDPNAAFYDAFFADPEFRLPPGEWQITTVAVFDDGDTCTASPTELAATITLTVEPGEPTESAEPSPSVETSAAPSDPEPAFTCDQPIALEAEGSDFHPLLISDIRLGTHDEGSHGGFERIVFEFVDDGTPELRIDLAQPPFVQDPSGLPLEVAGSPIYSVTLIGATKHDLETGAEPYTGSTDFRPGFGQIAQFVESGDFEAVNNWYLGTNGSTCLRAFTLTDPSRLVIDIQH